MRAFFCGVPKGIDWQLYLPRLRRLSRKGGVLALDDGDKGQGLDPLELIIERLAAIWRIARKAHPSK